jgi:uncharacterized protein YjdB
VASVSTSGLVTAHAAGDAAITATSEGKSGSSSVTVTPAPPAPVASVTVSPGAVNLRTGESRQLSVTLRDAAGNVLTGRAVTWSSSNAVVASVSTTGLVTGLLPGQATITATSEGQSGSARATVTLTEEAAAAEGAKHR